MTLKEAIIRYTSNAEYERTHENLQGCLEFRQLAEWLKELKALREVCVSEAFDMAIEALGQEPREDAISRQVVLEVLKDKWNMFSDANDAMQESIDTIEALRPVTSQQKTGRWVDDKCSVCGKGIENLIASPEWHRDEEPNFCPFCGANMQKVEDDT